MEISPTSKAAYEAIISFVKDLSEVFPSKRVSPLALYARLLDKIHVTDTNSVEKFLEGFRAFFAKHEKAIVDDTLSSIPKDTRICYGENNHIYIDIQRFIYQSDEESRDVIRRHLLIINALLEPSNKHLSILENEDKKKGPSIDTRSKEGKFMSEIMERAKDTMKNTNAENPMGVIMNLATSGVLTDMFTGLQNGVTKGELDPQKLMAVMGDAMKELMPNEQKTKSVVEEVSDEPKESEKQD